MRRSAFAAETCRIWIDGVLAFEGGGAPEVAPACAGPLAGVAQTTDILRVVLHPLVPLASLVTVAVRVVGQAIGGGGSIDDEYSFVVEDRTAPRVVGAQALAQRILRVAFDEPVLLPAGTSFIVTPRGAPAVTPGIASAVADGSLVLLTLDSEMTPDGEHQVAAAGVTDQPGAVHGPALVRQLFAAQTPRATTGCGGAKAFGRPTLRRRDDGAATCRSAARQSTLQPHTRGPFRSRPGHRAHALDTRPPPEQGPRRGGLRPVCSHPTRAHDHSNDPS